MAKEELKPIDVSKYTITETGQVLKMNKNKRFLNGGRGSGKTFRLLCEIYENKIADLEKENAELKADNDARKFAMAMSEKVEKQLREENTKLKDVIEGYKKIAKWCDKCDKIAELERKYQELVDKLHHCWNCKKSFDKSCSFGKMLEAEKKKCKDWESTFGISN